MKLTWSSILAAALLLGAGCDSKSGAPASTSKGGAGKNSSSKDAGNDAGKGQPTFSAVFSEIIVGTGCNGGALCHGGVVGNLTMNDKAATYKALVGVQAMGKNLMPMPLPDCKDSGLTRVVPGDPDNSLMIMKVEHTQPCGDSMPPGGMLAADKVAQLRAWIMNGANDD
jgi:hypothetical protein